MARTLEDAFGEAGDRVVLLSGTRWEWTVLDYAIWCAGAVSVPVYRAFVEGGEVFVVQT